MLSTTACSARRSTVFRRRANAASLLYFIGATNRPRWFGLANARPSRLRPLLALGHLTLQQTVVPVIPRAVLRGTFVRRLFPHAKRSRMTTFHVEPFTHMAGAICVYKLWLGHRRSLFDAFDRCPPEPLFYSCVIPFAFCASLGTLLQARWSGSFEL